MKGYFISIKTKKKGTKISKRLNVNDDYYSFVVNVFQITQGSKNKLY